MPKVGATEQSLLLVAILKVAREDLLRPSSIGKTAEARLPARFGFMCERNGIFMYEVLVFY